MSMLKGRCLLTCFWFALLHFPFLKAVGTQDGPVHVVIHRENNEQETQYVKKISKHLSGFQIFLVTLYLENEACERLVSRLWWYKCYRGTLLREGTPPVLGVENEACGRIVSRLWWYKCYRGTLLREGTPPAICPEHQNIHLSLVRRLRNRPRGKNRPRGTIVQVAQIAQEAPNRPRGTKSPRRLQNTLSCRQSVRSSQSFAHGNEVK